MAVLSNVAKYDSLNAIIPSGSTIKLAFYSSASTIDATTQTYTATNEVTQGAASPAINAGGLALSGRTITASDGSVATAGVDFSDLGPITPSGGTFAFRKIMIYDSTRNRALMIHDYGVDQNWAAGTPYTLVIPGTGTYVFTLA
jgi:hypothetical protein